MVALLVQEVVVKDQSLNQIPVKSGISFYEKQNFIHILIFFGHWIRARQHF